jgi:hypothetical protein
MQVQTATFKALVQGEKQFQVRGIHLLAPMEGAPHPGRLTS